MRGLEVSFFGVFLGLIAVILVMVFFAASRSEQDCRVAAQRLGGAPRNPSYMGCYVVMPDGTMKKP